MVLEIEGPGTEQLDNEAGGHRLQRVPPTERRGRVHSSTVTVAVLGASSADLSPYQQRREQDYLIEWYSGSGAGGQYRNKHQNSARITHVPTGITRSAQTRSRENSLRSAMTAINQELDRMASQACSGTENRHRREQVGTGQRSDKRRTIRFQDGLVHDHVTGKTLAINRYLNGWVDALWPAQ